LLLVAYSRALGLGPGGLSESIVLALAGGQLGVLGALAWSVALGCLAAVVMLAAPPLSMSGAHSPQEVEVSTRGPVSYAGPGSLGGTESALRR
jgi:hypothetical protein